MGAKFSKSEIGEVIRRVITYYLRKKELHFERRKELFLIPRFPVGMQELLSEFELYGELESVDFFLEEEGLEILDITGCRMYYMFDKKDVSYILNGLSAYERLEIYDPSLELLREIREGKERDLPVKIALYFLMTGKPVIVRFPYEMNTLSGGYFGRTARGLKEDLTDMGIVFLDLKPDIGEWIPGNIEGAAALVTEEMVEQAYEKGRRLIYMEKGCVVTPLAKDRAKERGISIISG